MRWSLCIAGIIFLLLSCGKSNDGVTPVAPGPVNISATNATIGAVPFDDMVYGAGVLPSVRVVFSGPVRQSTVAGAVSLTESGGSAVQFQSSFPYDSVLLIQPAAPLKYLAKYLFKITSALKSSSGGILTAQIDKTFITQIDSSRKFPALSDDALLTLVQQQTFKYFWDFAHPVSGLARERNNSGDVVTSGGSGFGIMALITGVSRNFITRTQGLTRMQTMVSFLKNTAQTFHGAFPHWLNGATGAVVPFSTKDNGADLVETSYLMQGLLCARQYFSGADPAETALRNDINTLWNNVDWSWFRQGNQQVLYWHWSPNYNWEMNLQIRGWNECLVTYVLAASSATHGIPASVYTNGWAGGPGFVNGNTYYGYPLPLGPAYGGPLFFAHYSFLGINPNGLSDSRANYFTQNKNHSLINYTYCKTNPANRFGYSDSVWGLTASDIPSGYAASSPTNDLGVIAPTAALSSFPYTPEESMKALKFFYYALGDKLWKEYGFVDAFSLKDLWFAGSFLAIDQGPIIVMIENHRTGLLWSLFTSCPEVKAGMQSLGFTAPYL